MLRNCGKLKGRRLGAVDGEIGKIQDFYFDDQHWTVRYLVADTGYWLPDRLVLISPHAVRFVAEEENQVKVQLTREQIENSPPITADQPVSRQYERDYYQYYGWPLYWTGPALWGPGPDPLYFAPLPSQTDEQAAAAHPGDPHLRSVQELIAYHIRALDGEIGHVEDAIVDDKNWMIRYFVVDTRNWLPGKRVLIAPPWIQGISWEESVVSVDLPRAQIQQAPEYDSGQPVSRSYEVELFKHYSRAAYWPAEAAA